MPGTRVANQSAGRVSVHEMDAMESNRAVTNMAQTLSPVKRVLLTQLSAAFAVAFALGLFGRAAALSALAGGLICAIANTYAGWRVFSTGTRASVYAELQNMYRAEFGKLILIGSLCAAVFAAVPDIHVVAFVGGCIGVIIAGTVGAATHAGSCEPGQSGTGEHKQTY